MSSNMFLDTKGKRLRPYQVRIVNEIGASSSIVKMPTGSGKTLVAAECICRRRHLQPLTAKALFLVPTCDLVAQQAIAVREWCATSLSHAARVAEFMGGAAVPTVWDILVATPEAFRRLQLRDPRFVWSEFGIVVFDEVHHVLKDHPYRRLAHSLRKGPAATEVQVLGLSASLTYAVGKGAVEKALQGLARDLGLERMVTVSDEELRAGGYNPPHGEVEITHPRVLPEGLLPEDERRPHLMQKTFFDRLRRGESTPLVKQVMAVVRDLELIAVGMLPEFSSPLSSAKLISWETYVHKLANNKGAHCAPLLQKMEVWYVALRLLAQSWEEEEQLVLNWLLLEDGFAVTGVLRNSALEELKMQQLQEDVQAVRKVSENESNLSKLACLKAQLLEKQKVFGSEFRGIVFVEQRITAHILARSIGLDAELRKAGLRADYVTSREATVTASIAVSNDAAAQCIQRFRTGEVNVVVATSVIEEGFDVPAANVVISFDHLKNSVELAQRFGRARQADRRIVVMDQRSDRPIHRLEEVRQEQDALVLDFVVPPSKEHDEAERAAQRSRERGAKDFFRGKGPASESAVQNLNLYVKKTKAQSSERFHKVDGNVQGCVLTYSSVLREVHGEGTGQKAQIAKQAAAADLLRKLLDVET